MSVAPVAAWWLDDGEVVAIEVGDSLQSISSGGAA